MKLLFKQRVFSWFDSYDIYDENGDTVYQVKGEFSWGHRLQIYDAAGNHAGTVKEKMLTFLPKFQLSVGDKYVGEVAQEMTLFKPRYLLECKGWEIQGDIFEWNYRVTDQNGALIMIAEKKLLNFSDTYIMDIMDSENALYCLMIVLAIDAAKCSRNN